MFPKPHRSVAADVWAVLLLAIYLVRGCGGACPGSPDRSVEFATIDEPNYDKNYSSITSEGKRPLGFEKAVWSYNQVESPSPCIRISSVGSKFLEIMFETFPPSRLCISIPGNQPQCSDPGTGRLTICRKPTGNTAYVEFTCDSQCSESDVQFWYRLTLGVPYEDDPEEHWCNDRHSLYPEDLRQLPSGYPINTQESKPSNVASTCYSCLNLSLLILFSVAFSFVSLLCGNI